MVVTDAAPASRSFQLGLQPDGILGNAKALPARKLLL